MDGIEVEHVVGDDTGAVYVDMAPPTYFIPLREERELPHGYNDFALNEIPSEEIEQMIQINEGGFNKSGTEDEEDEVESEVEDQASPQFKHTVRLTATTVHPSLKAKVRKRNAIQLEQKKPTPLEGEDSPWSDAESEEQNLKKPAFKHKLLKAKSMHKLIDLRKKVKRNRQLCNDLEQKKKALIRDIKAIKRECPKCWRKYVADGEEVRDPVLKTKVPKRTFRRWERTPGRSPSPILSSRGRLCKSKLQQEDWVMLSYSKRRYSARTPPASEMPAPPVPETPPTPRLGPDGLPLPKRRGRPPKIRPAIENQEIASQETQIEEKVIDSKFGTSPTEEELYRSLTILVAERSAEGIVDEELASFLSQPPPARQKPAERVVDDESDPPPPQPRRRYRKPMRKFLAKRRKRITEKAREKPVTEESGVVTRGQRLENHALEPLELRAAEEPMVAEEDIVESHVKPIAVEESTLVAEEKTAEDHDEPIALEESTVLVEDSSEKAAGQDECVVGSTSTEENWIKYAKMDVKLRRAVTVPLERIDAPQSPFKMTKDEFGSLNLETIKLPQVLLENTRCAERVRKPRMRGSKVRAESCSSEDSDIFPVRLSPIKMPPELLLDSSEDDFECVKLQPNPRSVRVRMPRLNGSALRVMLPRRISEGQGEEAALTKMALVGAGSKEDLNSEESGEDDVPLLRRISLMKSGSKELTAPVNKVIKTEKDDAAPTPPLDEIPPKRLSTRRRNGFSASLVSEGQGEEAALTKMAARGARSKEDMNLEENSEDDVPLLRRISLTKSGLKELTAPVIEDIKKEKDDIAPTLPCDEILSKRLPTRRRNGLSASSVDFKSAKRMEARSKSLGHRLVAPAVDPGKAWFLNPVVLLDNLNVALGAKQSHGDVKLTANTFAQVTEENNEQLTRPESAAEVEGTAEPSGPAEASLTSTNAESVEKEIAAETPEGDLEASNAESVEEEIGTEIPGGELEETNESVPPSGPEFGTTENHDEVRVKVEVDENASIGTEHSKKKLNRRRSRRRSVKKAVRRIKIGSGVEDAAVTPPAAAPSPEVDCVMEQMDGSVTNKLTEVVAESVPDRLVDTEKSVEGGTPTEGVASRRPQRTKKVPQRFGKNRAVKADEDKLPETPSMKSQDQCNPRDLESESKLELVQKARVRSRKSALENLIHAESTAEPPVPPNPEDLAEPTEVSASFKPLPNSEDLKPANSTNNNQPEQSKKGIVQNTLEEKSADERPSLESEDPNCSQVEESEPASQEESKMTKKMPRQRQRKRSLENDENVVDKIGEKPILECDDPYTPGDLVWVRRGPSTWPAIVVVDAAIKNHIYRDGERISIYVHAIGDEWHSWSDLHDMERFIGPTKTAPEDVDSWNSAVTNATTYMDMPPSDRLSLVVTAKPKPAGETPVRAPKAINRRASKRHHSTPRPGLLMKRPLDRKPKSPVKRRSNVKVKAEKEDESVIGASDVLLNQRKRSADVSSDAANAEPPKKKSKLSLKTELPAQTERASSEAPSAISSTFSDSNSDLSKVGKRVKNFIFKDATDVEVCSGCGIVSPELLYQCQGVCRGFFHAKCSSAGADEALPADWTCQACRDGKNPCFVCKEATGMRQMCLMDNCGKFYHRKCLALFPQTKLNYGKRQNRGLQRENEDGEGDEPLEILRCAYHTCHTCSADNPPEAVAVPAKQLVTCVKCPTAFHKADFCIPAGTEVLTKKEILCHKHLQRKQKPLNVNYCLLCGKGGGKSELICCDSCPSAIHVDCLDAPPPEGDYFCEECESGRFPLYGEVVWAKYGSYRWWPAQIVYPHQIPLNVSAMKHIPHQYVVQFFGTFDYAWVHNGAVCNFCENDSRSKHLRGGKAINAKFNTALVEAEAEVVARKEAMAKHSEGRSQPPKYYKIQQNKYRKGLGKDDSVSIQECVCTDKDEDPCGPTSQCLNRLINIECTPDHCQVGDACQNRRFQKRIYPPLKPIKCGGRGWGLVSTVDIHRGQFIIEYVGEIIDQKELEARLAHSRQAKLTHFYFLCLDNNVYVDAGPMGNLARFMNHSCEPNCATEKWTVNGQRRIGLFAKDDIKKGTELTFNYDWESLGAAVPCFCGAPSCSGYFGKTSKTKKLMPAES